MTDKLTSLSDKKLRELQETEVAKSAKTGEPTGLMREIGAEWKRRGKSRVYPTKKNKAE